MAREGVEPTDHQGLSLAALPVCVSCHRSPISQRTPMGFEPMVSTLTGWRALRAAPRGHLDRKRNGSGGIQTLSISRFKRQWSAGCLPSHLKARGSTAIVCQLIGRLPGTQILSQGSGGHGFLGIEAVSLTRRIRVGRSRCGRSSRTRSTDFPTRLELCQLVEMPCGTMSTPWLAVGLL